MWTWFSRKSHQRLTSTSIKAHSLHSNGPSSVHDGLRMKTVEGSTPSTAGLTLKPPKAFAISDYFQKLPIPSRLTIFAFPVLPHDTRRPQTSLNKPICSTLSHVSTFSRRSLLQAHSQSEAPASRICTQPIHICQRIPPTTSHPSQSTTCHLDTPCWPCKHTQKHSRSRSPNATTRRAPPCLHVSPHPRLSTIHRDTAGPETGTACIGPTVVDAVRGMRFSLL
jgi:hypothetical protein